MRPFGVEWLTIGTVFSGALDLGMTKSGLNFSIATTLFNQFDAQLNAVAVFSLDDPEFTVHGLMQNDFGASITPELTQKVKTRAQASVSLADTMLRRGLTGWTGFRTNPHALTFASRITGFASAAEWETSQWQSYITAIQDWMSDIDRASPTTPPELLDKALGGYTTPGIPGVTTRVCVRFRLVPPFDCLEYQYFCNGLPSSGGPCWTVPPITIGGACHDPQLSQFNIPCQSTPFIEQKLIPPLIARIDAILRNQGRAPMIAIERAEFTTSLNSLTTTPTVTLSTRLRFMQAATRLNLATSWNFNQRDGSLNAMRDALIDAL